MRTRPDPAAEWEDAHAVEGQEPPPPPPGEPEALPLLARGFEVDRGLERARLYATGLGVYEARLNGGKVGDAVLEPANTDFRKRVHYSTYDVTEMLRRGPNKLGFALGNGIYNVRATPGRYQKFSGSMGPPKLIAQLELTYADGSTRTIATDDSWGAALGPVTFSGWYGGEDHDARRELGGWDEPGFDVRGFAPKAAGKDADGVRKGFAPGDWTSAAVTDPPSADTVLSAQEAPPVRVQERLSAVSREQVAPGVWLYDLGRNIAGWPQITVSGAAGETLRMTPGERLTDGRVDQRQVGQPVTFDYTAASDREVSWHPRFMYYGFRWIEVSGVEEPPAPEDVGTLVLRADNQRAGSLRTSDETLNRVHELVVRAIEGNMLSVLTDCPHREKLGWLEVTHLMFDGVAANFDVAAYYRQQVRNMADAQLENGMVPDIAPEYTVFSGGFRDDPNWGGAIVLAPLRMYERYGDARVLHEHYEAMDRYMGYLATKATDGLLTYGLGDWGAFDTSTPIGIPATSVYYRMAEAMATIADVTGHDADVARYRELAEATRARFNAAFLDPAAGSYGSGSQASNALPLAAGMVPEASREAVLDSLLSDIESREWHLSTGEIGLRALLDSLGEAGEIDAVLDLATNPTPPSHAHMVSSGATSLPEFWDLEGSLNHFMMGAIDDWMYRYLAGIQPAAPGFSEIRIAPRLTDRLDHVRAVWPSPYGRIVSAWKRRGERVELEVEIPVNTTATVELPDGTTREVGSGRWRFEVRE